MKKIVILLAALTIHAHALDDDLFWKAGRQGPTARSFIWRGQTYQSVRIAHFDGKSVLLTYANGKIKVPFADVPSLWQSAIQQRRWSPRPPDELNEGGGRASRPAVQTRKSDADLPPAPRYTTFKEWDAARVKVVEKVRALAAARWKDKYSMQEHQVAREMQAWIKLNPRPAVPELSTERNEGEAGGGSKPEDYFNYRWEDVYAADTETDESVYAYNTRAEQNRKKALIEAKSIALKTWPNADNLVERQAKEAALMQLWDSKNPFITKGSNLLNVPDSEDIARIKRQAERDWPDDFPMQLSQIKRETLASRQIDQWIASPPFGLSRDDFFKLWDIAIDKWPGKYDPQVSEMKRQGKAMAELKKLTPSEPPVK